MEPIELPVRRVMSVGLSFAFSDPKMVPDFLRDVPPPTDKNVFDDEVPQFESLDLMEAALTFEQMEAMGMMFRGAGARLASDVSTVHFSFSRALDELPLVRFAEQCRKFLVRMSNGALWRASCWKLPFRDASSGEHILDFRFKFPSSVDDAGELPARRLGSIRYTVDVIAVYPASGRQLRRAS